MGQSLGGALALQIALDYPELVAGMVLIDPTPVNDVAICRQAAMLYQVLALPTRLPLVGSYVNRGLWRAMSGRAKVAGPEARASLEVMMWSASLATTAGALDTLVADAQAFRDRLAAGAAVAVGPVVLLTADRKPDRPVRLAHDRLATAFGADIVSWPGAVHAEHLREPVKVRNLVRSVLTTVGTGS